MTSIQQLNPGIYKNVPNALYQSLPAMSNSRLKDMKIPANYQYYAIHGKEYGPITEKNFNVGTVTHHLLFEPGNENLPYAISPNFNKRTKQGKADFEQWMQGATGLAIIDQSDFDICQKMVEAVNQHPEVKKLLNRGEPESSYLWHDKITGELCKCRPDWFIDDLGIIVDLKTTQDASPEGFIKSVYNFGYHIQAAFYLDGVNAHKDANQFIFIAVEKKPPYNVGVYRLDFDSVWLGRDTYQELLKEYVSCKTNNDWPGYSNEIETLSLPQWCFPEIELTV